MAGSSDKANGPEAGVTRYISAFASDLRFEEIPGDVLDRGALHILDSLGLALAGARAPVSRALHAHLAASGMTDGPVTILGTGSRAAGRFAAQANATAIHADNFDDTNPQASPDRNGGIHATGPVLAAALAVAESNGRSGRDFLTAFHAGVEVACRLNHAMAARHYEGGFHTTGTLTIFGATVAAARLSGLDADGLGHALAGAASRASGIRRNFGSMVEPLHAGCAAEDGVAVADLAARGVTGASEILEGPVGFFEAAGGGYDIEAIAGRLGAPWAFVDPGMWLKPYPSGALTHPAMACLSQLIDAHGIASDLVDGVRVTTNPRMRDTLIHHRPTTALQAKFSMEFCLSILLLDRQAGLGAFTDAVVRRDDVQEMIGRIQYDTFAQPEPDYTNVTTLLEIRLKDGRSFDGRADFAKGSSRNPMTREEVTQKFLECAAHAGWPDERARRIADAVDDIPNSPDIRALTAHLRA